MKKKLRLLPIALLLIIGVLFTGCSNGIKEENKSSKALINCLNKSISANSMQVDTNMYNDDGMTLINIKAEDIHKDFRQHVSIDDEVEGSSDYYISRVDKQCFMYENNDESGSDEYSSSCVDYSEIKDEKIDEKLKKLLVDIKKDSQNVKLLGQDDDEAMFSLKGSKKILKKLYKDLSGEASQDDVDSASNIVISIGRDGYLKKINLSLKSSGIVEEYSNLNKEIGVNLPQ